MSAKSHSPRIILGITGSIAAYKTCELTRLLVKAGAQVRVILSAQASTLVAPLALQTLSHHPVYRADDIATAEDPMLHITLAKWATHILIAPASAATIGRLANGIYDDLLTLVCSATTAPITLAPAMNQQMWDNVFIQQNCAKLRKAGYEFIGPDAGDQACGDVGLGRMSEPEAIVAALQPLFNADFFTVHAQSIAAPNVIAQLAPQEGKHGKKVSENVGWQTKTVLITAGPTQEALDPVRYLTNHSSGKMGFALASAFKAVGARVILVHGPCAIQSPMVDECIAVTSAQQMHDAVLNCLEQEKIDVFVAAAAVADYRPVEVQPQKIKKHAESIILKLEKNPDILRSVCQRFAGGTDSSGNSRHHSHPYIVGFAAETENLLENAARKLQDKGADMIVANLISEENNPFYADKNSVVILRQGVEPISLALEEKTSLAHKIVSEIGKVIEK